jgi:glycosyltransferase involved in cell wall biosynthesis
VRVAFVIKDLRLSGGVGVVIEHARHLVANHEFEVTLVHAGERSPDDWPFRHLAHLEVLSPDEAAARTYDVAVSTWWQTAASLFDLTADRYVSFVQSLEERFYAQGDANRFAAALSLNLPVTFVTEAQWLARALDAMRPGTRTFYVRNGIAKDVFAPPQHVTPSFDAPLRILVEGSRRTAFKGVEEALAAAGAMSEERHVTLVTPDDSGADAPEPDRTLQALSQADMAAAYAETDVVLKLSRVEGMSGPPLEGFHKGATCVVTPVTGHEEYVRHLVNGLIVDWDDLAGTTRALDLLARDRSLLHGLRSGALATAKAWPSWDQQATVMAAVLRAIHRSAPPSPRPLGRRLARDHQAIVGEAQRQHLLATYAQAQLAETRALRAFRWGLAVRDVALVFLRPARKLRARLRRRRA